MLERAGSGEAQLGDAIAHLVTETGEARLNGMLDAALGNDRRKLDRFFAGLGDENSGGRRVASAWRGARRRIAAQDFCSRAETGNRNPSRGARTG